MTNNLPGITAQNLRPGQDMCLIPAQGVPGGDRIRPDDNLPDPNTTGPCQVQASVLCRPSEGIQRLNPTDMLNISTAFTSYTMCCLPCYERQADLFIEKTHGRSVTA